MIKSGADNAAKGKDDPAYRGLNRKSSNYYRKLAQCSCNYNESKREGIIYTYNKDDSKKMKFMLKKKIKMILCGCDLCIFLLTEDGEVYYDKGQLGYKYDQVFADKHCEIEFENLYLKIVKITSGYTRTLTLTDCGHWSGNAFGQLGLDHIDNVFKSTLSCS
ncbi:uncharacterized protein LOC105833408 isoform X2 [Monomorium pharaonis]|uniref:uncharacterized protein LOC105833408 isoform X2 n=1 Tax=Monomorium pharaonis TaxID=307658 RepID=UPI00063F4F9C|nr:uncharacterized protein LOC105833408 isoform X2 [Monomorium pharaonis]